MTFTLASSGGGIRVRVADWGGRATSSGLESYILVMDTLDLRMVFANNEELRPSKHRVCSDILKGKG